MLWPIINQGKQTFLNRSFMSCLFLILCHCFDLVLISPFLDTLLLIMFLPLSPQSHCVPFSLLSVLPFRSSAMLFGPVYEKCGQELRVGQMGIKLLSQHPCSPVFCISAMPPHPQCCNVCLLQLFMVWLPAFRHFTREKCTELLLLLLLK